MDYEGPYFERSDGARRRFAEAETDTGWMLGTSVNPGLVVSSPKIAFRVKGGVFSARGHWSLASGGSYGNSGWAEICTVPAAIVSLIPSDTALLYLPFMADVTGALAVDKATGKLRFWPTNNFSGPIRIIRTMLG